MKKLKSRLILVSVIMLVLPLIMIVGSFFAVFHFQMKSMEKDYGIEVSYENLSDNATLVSNLTASYVMKLQTQILNDASKLEDTSYLEKMNTELQDKQSWLILRINDEIVWTGIPEERMDIQDELYSSLPAYDAAIDNEESCIYVGGNVQALVKQLDYQTPEGKEASLFLVTESAALAPQIQKLFTKLIVIIVLVQLITCAMMSFWIYTSINAPLNQLKEATNHIKDGNLDFTVDGCDIEEINTLCEDFEDMRKRLKTSAEEKVAFDQESKALISNISHDLKTPITAVKGYVEGIMDGVADTPEKRERYIRTIYNKAVEMDRLINELTFYSKIDTNRIPYTFSKISAAEYFDDCVEELSMDLEAQGIELTYSCQIGYDILIIADVEQLRRVINNIVSNSVKYMDKEKKKIQIRLRDAGDYIQVEMEDNGKGIEAKDIVNIFERFYRTDASRNSSKGGSGIGLSIVKKILEDHGGKVWATSVDGEGTTIYFVLRKYQEVPVV